MKQLRVYTWLANTFWWVKARNVSISLKGQALQVQVLHESYKCNNDANSKLLTIRQRAVMWIVMEPKRKM